MYGRNINFTLLAPSLWAVVQAIGSNVEEDKYKRMLFKTGDNNGFIVEIFENINIAGKKIETMKFKLASGSLLLMEESTQHNWYHKIAKTSKKISPRINLTYRKINI